MNGEIRMTNDELPEGWQSCALGDVVDYGKTRKAEPSKISAKSWILELEDIEKDTSQLLSRVTFAERKSKSTKNRFETGDVLYGKLRPYLNKILIADQPGYCTTEIIPLRGNGTLENRYLFYWLKHPTFLDYVTAVSHGLNMPRLGTEAGRAAPFILAPLAEQKRIADKLEVLLGRVDACRARLDRVPALLKRFRQSVLAAATSGRLTEEWRMTNGANDELHNVEIEFEDATLTLPSTWKVTRADAVCSSVRDGTHDTPKYVKSGIPLVTSKNIRPAGIDFEGAQQISQDDHREISKRSKVDIGDVLFSMIGSVGHICIVETRREFSIKNVGLFKNNPGTVLPQYMFYWLQGPLFSQWLDPRLRGGNQKFASLGLLRESPVFLPPLSEQQEIVRRVEDLFAFADRIEARLATARKTVERLTPATLTKAFRGELVPQDPNDEPAAAMLERLRSGVPEGGGSSRKSKAGKR